MIFRYEGYCDPLRLTGHHGYVEADDIGDAVIVALQLLEEAARACHASPGYEVVTKIEETDIKIQQPNTRRRIK